MKELLEKRAKVFEQARALVLKAESEHRAMTSEEVTEYEARMAEVTAIGETIKRSRQSSEMDAELSRSIGPARELPQQRNSGGPVDEALVQFIRGGLSGMTQEQRGAFVVSAASKADIITFRAASPLSAVTSGAGVETVPQGFVYSLERAKLWVGGVRQTRATVMRTSTGNPMPYPTTNDTNNEGVECAENAQVAQATTEMSFGSVTFGGIKYSTRPVLVPIELIQDGAFDIQGLVAGQLGERLGRIQNRRFTSGLGSGSGQPNGVITAATNAFTTVSATAIAYSEFVDLEHAVDPSYRIGAEWMFNDSTAALLEKMVDNNGRPLLNESFAAIAANIKAGDANAPVKYTLKGYPVVLNSHMDGPVATKKAVVFGDFSKYIIREVMDLMLVRYGELFMRNGQIGFEAFERVDGNLVDAGTHPVKYLTMHA